MSTHELRIRPAVHADSEALSDLAYRAIKSNGYDDTTMAKISTALEFTPTRLSTQRFWVAEEDCQIIGCLALAPLDARTAEVRSFFIDPAYKNRGIGGQLWLRLLTIAQSQGLTRLIAQADPATLKFYESLGFVTEKMARSRTLPDKFVPHMIREI